MSFSNSVIEEYMCKWNPFSIKVFSVGLGGVHPLTELLFGNRVGGFAGSHGFPFESSFRLLPALEFLGDAILDYLITKHLYEDSTAALRGPD